MWGSLYPGGPRLGGFSLQRDSGVFTLFSLVFILRSLIKGTPLLDFGRLPQSPGYENPIICENALEFTA